MRTSSKGLELIAGFEGLRTVPYNDPVGFATIGVGHLIRRGPVNAIDRAKYKGFTRADAMNMLRRDIVSRERMVSRGLKRKVTQDQFDALVSLAFNVGAGAVVDSTLMRRLNAGDIHGAADEFLKWDVAGGRHLPGLHTRRVAERKLFLKGSSFTKRKALPLPKNWWKRYVYGDTGEVNRSLLVKLARVAKAHKTRIFVRSGGRSHAEQVILYKHYLQYGHPLAAKPGTSHHEYQPPAKARAADSQIGGRSRNLGDVVSHAELRKYGLILPVPGEPWHAEEA